MADEKWQQEQQGKRNVGAYKAREDYPFGRTRTDSASLPLICSLCWELQADCGKCIDTRPKPTRVEVNIDQFRATPDLVLAMALEQEVVVKLNNGENYMYIIRKVEPLE